jgi:hypothetical protein
MKLLKTPKIYSILFILFYCNFLIGQKEIQTTYIRPSIVNLYGQSEPNNKYNIALKNLKKYSSPLKRFDKLTVDYPKIILKNLIELPLKPVLPKMPIKPDSNATKKDISIYNEQVRSFLKDKSKYKSDIRKFNTAVSERNESQNRQIDKFIKQSSRDIIGTWFSRDSLGNMSSDLWNERVNHAKTDDHVNLAKNSAINRTTLLGEDLIKKTYVIIHLVDKIYTYKEFYDNKDRENEISGKYQKKKNKPILRLKEGYLSEYKSYLYKLDFNDSLLIDFYDRYWLDEYIKTGREEKIADWEKATFPINYISLHNFKQDNSQLSKNHYLKMMKTNPAMLVMYNKKIKSIPPVENLIPRIGAVNLTSKVLNINIKNIEDFKLKVPVFSAYPILAKIGTKEGIKKNKRWAIYEIKIDKNGHQKKHKSGYARITEIGQNDTIASGNSATSIFRQHGGKRTYSGMLLEPKHGGFFEFGIGNTSSPNDMSLKGTTFDISLRLFKSFKVGYNRSFTNFSIDDFVGLKLGNQIEYTDTLDVTYTFSDTIIKKSSDVKGTATSYNFNFGKEFLIGDRGNLILEPRIGIGWSKYKFNYEDLVSDSIKEIIPNNEIADFYNLKSRTFVISLAVGFHITPNIILSFKPSLVSRIKYESNSQNNAKVSILDGNDDSSWGFDKLNGSITFPMFFGVKFKL